MSDQATRSLRVVRVVPDIAGIEAEFDYLVPARWDHLVHLGSLVRIPVNGRRVAGWIVDTDSTPPESVTLKEITKISSLGPPDELIELSKWAAHQWFGKRSFWLQTASPPRMVARLPSPRTAAAGSLPESSTHFEGHTIVRWPPANDPFELVCAAVDQGPSLILAPSPKSAERLVERIRRSNREAVFYPEQWAAAAAGNVTVVGTRAAAWAPMPELTTIVILDAHDEAYRAEGSPTWDAVAVCHERAQRRNVPITLVSAVPRVEHLRDFELQTIDRDHERRGWAKTTVVDLRHSDPRSGLYSPPLVTLLRSEARVLCVLNRKGRSSLLVCTACDQIASCEKCEGSLTSVTEDLLHCRRCGTDQPVVCRHCGSQGFRQLRLGVTKVREELEALAGRPVGEVTGDSDTIPDTEVIVGTEAVLHRVGRADAVVFLDFDQELLRSRIRANEDALILLARASKIVRGRATGSSNGNDHRIVLIQTRQPEHEVVLAAVHSDPGRLIEGEEMRRRVLRWPPFAAIATASGKNAQAFVDQAPLGLEVLGPDKDHWLLRAPSQQVLADGLATMKRPTGRMALQVNPYRI